MVLSTICSYGQNDVINDYSLEGLSKVCKDCVELTSFYNGKATIIMKNGVRKTVDKMGNTSLYKEVRDSLGYEDWMDEYSDEDVREGMKRILRNDKYGYSDIHGNIIVSPKYDDAEPFHEGLAIVQNEGLYGYIDKSGKEIVSPKLREAYNFSEGLAKVIYDNICYINKMGQIAFVVPEEFDGTGSFHEGLVRAHSWLSEKFGFLNRVGKIAIPFVYDEVGDFNNGLAIVVKDNKYGCINKSGDVVIPFMYDYLSNFVNGLAYVSKEGKKGYINPSNEVVVPIIYDSIKDSSEGLEIVEKEHKFGCINKEGNIVIPCIYDEIDNFSEGLAVAKKDGKVGYIDKQGRSTFDL